jgi:hypothetical protein
MFHCDEMLVCEGVGRILNEDSEVKCSGQGFAIPHIVLHMHTEVLIPKLIIIFKIPMSLDPFSLPNPSIHTMPLGSTQVFNSLPWE